MPHLPTLVRISNVSLVLSGRRILDDVSLSVAPNEFIGLIGPNGGGKTTFLRVLLGLVPPSSGAIEWSSTSTRARPRVGYVPQKILADPSYPLQCREIILQGQPARSFLWGKHRSQSHHNADLWIDRLGLSDCASTPAVDLSGGQQRRMLLARALMARPNLLLLDEPTAGVDSRGQSEFCQLLNQLCAEGIAIILISHDIPLVTEHAHRIACLAAKLHWHGHAHALTDEIIRQAYACELDRYRTGHHHDQPRQSHPQSITFHKSPTSRHKEASHVR